MAFFVFLAGAAGAGVVATYFCAGPDRFWRFSLRGAGLILQLFLLTLLLALHFAGERGEALRRRFAGAGCGAGDGSTGARAYRLRRGRLVRRAGSAPRGLFVLLAPNVEEIADRFVVDARHHVFKQDKGLFLEFDERIFLAVAAEADAFFQVVEGEKVVLPLGIDDVENDAAFEPADKVGAELLFFFLIARRDGFDGGFGEFYVAERGGIGAGGFSVDAELSVHFREELGGVPLVGMLVPGAEGVDQFARDVFRNAEDVIALIFSFERGAANSVNRLALLVHHVVVFEEVFARVEVLRFDRFLCVFDAAGDEAGLDGYAFGHTEAEHEGFHAFAAEDAHEIVFEGKEEARGARVALPAGASTELVIDAARFVAFGAENMQTAKSDDFVVLGLALLGELLVDGLPLVRGHLENFAFVLKQNHGHGGEGVLAALGRNYSRRGSVGHGHLVFQKIIAGHLLGIAAEKNVRAPASHVGGHGDGAFASSLRDDAGFALVLLGVQHLVRDAGLFQDGGDGFRFFNRDRSYQHRLAAFVIVADAVVERIIFLENSIDHRFEFFFFRAVDDVAMLFANQRAIGGDDDNIKIVNFAEFGGFRFRRAGHAGELFVHAEVILEGDGGERLIFTLDFDAFLGFDGLVQAIGPAAARHLAAGEFVDDDDLAVFIHVVDVNLVKGVGAQRLVHVVHDFDVRGIGHVAEVEQALALAEPFFGQRGSAVLFVERVVDILNELGNNLVDLGVFVRGFFGRTRNDQRRAGLVDEDGVHFVDDAELVAALDALREIVLHIVAQVVEAKFVVRAVSEISAVSGFALLVVQIVDDHADGKPQAAIERAHPLGVTSRQVVVYGDDVHAAPRQRV